MSRVFEDPSSRRRNLVQRYLWALLAGGSFLGGLFVLSLSFVPFFAPPALHPQRNIAQTLKQNSLHETQRKDLLEHQAKHRLAKAADLTKYRTERLAVAFYAPWEDAGLESFRAHAKHISVVIPAWLRLSDDGQSLDLRDYDLAVNPRNRALIQAARANGVAILPLLSNAKEGVFSADSVRRLLAKPETQEKLITNLVNWLVAGNFQGVNIDFELLEEKDWPALCVFLSKLNQQLDRHQLILTADVEAAISLKAVAPAVEICDWVVIMAYDEHSEEGEAGPISSRNWANGIWDRWAAAFDERKLVIAVGSYGYDWGQRGNAQSVSFDQALSLAKEYRDEEKPSEVIQVDPLSKNPWFRYETSSGEPHTVWFLDAVTAYSQWRYAQESGARGLALWVLGNEDPTVWSFLDRATLDRPPTPNGMETIAFPYDVNFVGRGEILQVRERPQTGKRSMNFDGDGKEIRTWQYLQYAFPFILAKSGYSSKKLVLTFDDGPDPEFTPRILRVLKKHQAPAVFFVVGQEAVRYPQILRQIYADGFEIGNHSYTHTDLGAVSPQRAELELNATQRALEAILGISSLLFRPPYNADSQPETAAEVAPVEVADRLHYLTVGENIDPNDWNLRQLNGDGTLRKKTSHDIAEAVLRDIDARAGSEDEGNIILLHDAGGDRSATVMALDEIIPQLRQKGYNFVSLAELLERSRDSLMPRIHAEDSGLVSVDRVVFGLVTWLGEFLNFAFVSGIVVGIGRALFVTVLALRNRRQRRFVVPTQPLRAGMLVAAWNEEKVIADTIHSLLASEGPIHEIIVVDDGSSDATSEVVRTQFANEARVRLLSKPNGGKASALNLGYQASTSEVLICVDADTVLDPKAAQLLLRHFDDPQVAAVAGNVRVGNANRLLTRWQSLEYTTSQNLDRRAAESLNAITVVPGAIGAWRRESVLKVGGYDTDTLAEDMDLTWKLRLAGYRIENEVEAISFTEAPQSLGAFVKQRFRWAFGTLQCLWKHRSALGRQGWFGRFALPQLWLFQVVFQILAPILDLTVAFSLLRALLVWVSAAKSSIELDRWSVVQGNLAFVLGAYGLFFAVELLQAWIAYSLEKRSFSDLRFLFVQRFVYRQIMYAVIWQAIWRALNGGATSWGKLRRLGMNTQEARQSN